MQPVRNRQPLPKPPKWMLLLFGVVLAIIYYKIWEETGWYTTILLVLLLFRVEYIALGKPKRDGRS